MKKFILANMESWRMHEDDGIFSEGTALHAYPDPDTVFADPELAKYLHPLLTIRLSAVRPEWQGQIHLVSPIEPMEGLLGMDTEAWHNHRLGTNWLSFHRDEDGRYSFPGDLRYFAFADPEAIRPEKRREELARYYAQENASYAAAKQRFRAAGGLYWPMRDDPLKPRLENGPSALLEQLGGQAGYGNWTESAALPAAYRMTIAEDSVMLQTEAGQPFHFIAGVPGYPWRDQGADWILLFYEPESQTVLQSFDWS